MVERWSVEDSQERRDRIKDADIRLEAWARWSRSGMRSGGASSSNWFMALGAGSAEEGQAGARHVAESCPDDEAMQVDAVVAHWQHNDRLWFAIAQQEYLHGGPQEAKARRLRISKKFYRTLLDELRLALWRELDMVLRFAKRSGRLAELPAAKDARFAE